MTMIDNKLMMGAVSKVHSDGRSAAFRANPSPATAAPIVVALVANLAALGNLKPAAVMAAASEMKAGKAAGTAAVAKVAAPATTEAAYAVGQTIKAPFEGALYEAQVLKVSGSKLRVEFTEDKVKATVLAVDCQAVKARGKAAKADEAKVKPAPKAEVVAEPVAAKPRGKVEVLPPEKPARAKGKAAKAA